MTLSIAILSQMFLLLLNIENSYLGYIYSKYFCEFHSFSSSTNYIGSS